MNGISVANEEFFSLTTLFDTAKESFHLPVPEAKNFKIGSCHQDGKSHVMPVLIQSVVSHVSIIGNSPKHFHKVKSFKVGVKPS
jgi:hypothetical protein